MSICGRRYNSERLNLVKYNFIEREKENNMYSLIDFNERNVSLFIDDHVDYVILSLVNAWKNKFIEVYTCNKLIDKIEGYYFAYQEELLNQVQLYHKINDEIVQYYLDSSIIGKMGVYRGRKKIDLCK